MQSIVGTCAMMRRVCWPVAADKSSSERIVREAWCHYGCTSTGRPEVRRRRD